MSKGSDDKDVEMVEYVAESLQTEDKNEALAKVERGRYFLTGNTGEIGEINDEFLARQREGMMNNFASNAWEAIHKKGVEVYTAVAQFFSDVAKFFNDLGTKIGKSISSFFETLSKKADSYNVSRSFAALKNEGMLEESVVRQNVAKKSKEDKMYDETRQKKAGIVADIKEKAENIGQELKHVVAKDVSKLMQDIRGAKGKPQGKGRD
jgi:hypothetical protein